MTNIPKQPTDLAMLKTNKMSIHDYFDMIEMMMDDMLSRNPDLFKPDLSNLVDAKHIVKAGDIYECVR